MWKMPAHLEAITELGDTKDIRMGLLEEKDLLSGR